MPGPWAVGGWVYLCQFFSLTVLAFMEDILWEVGLVCLLPVDLGLLKAMTSLLIPIGFPKPSCLDFSCTRGMDV